MLRLIFLLIAVYFALKLVGKVLLAGAQERWRTFHKTTQRGDGTQPTVLTSCPACGTYFQETQGVHGRGGVYCSAACARKT